MAQAAGSFCDGTMRDEVKALFSTHPAPAAERTLKQSLERMNDCVDLKARLGSQLPAWLQQQTLPAGN